MQNAYNILYTIVNGVGIDGSKASPNYILIVIRHN